MVILNLYGIPFHAVVVFRTEHDFLFKSASSYCVQDLTDSVIPLPANLYCFLVLNEEKFGRLGLNLYPPQQHFILVIHRRINKIKIC